MFDKEFEWSKEDNPDPTAYVGTFDISSDMCLVVSRPIIYLFEINKSYDHDLVSNIIWY